MRVRGAGRANVPDAADLSSCTLGRADTMPACHMRLGMISVARVLAVCW